MSYTSTYQNILAIDGSTPICTVALRVGEVEYVKKEIGMGIHSSAIFAQINETLKEAGKRFQDINVVVIGIGPGSYTGLRVVASSIKGLLFKSSIPLVGVNSLAGFASCVHGNSPGSIHAIIDARRNHLYYQCFSVGKAGIFATNKQPDLIEIPELYSKLLPGDSIIGTGIERLDSARLNQISVIPQDHVSASGLIQVFLSSDSVRSEWVKELDVAEFEPKYAIEDFK